MQSTLANANTDVKQLLIYQTLNLRSNVGMDMPANRRKRLDALIIDSFAGSKKSFCDATGLSESRLSQLLSSTYREGKEPGEKAARSLEKKLGLPPMYLDQDITPSRPNLAHLDGNFGARNAVKAVEEDDENTDIFHIRKVKLKLSAGIVGFSFEPEVEDANPIYFRREWFINRGYKPEKLIAIRVKGQSMEGGLHDGDTEQVEAIREAMQGRVLDGDHLAGWEKRQPKRERDDSEPTSTDRVKAYRERQRSETPCNATQHQETPREEEIRVDTDKNQRKSKAESATATRLPADWMPSIEEIEFCKTERKDLEPHAVASRFRDYWIAQPGAKGRKTDWPATWRNWVRNERAAPQARASPSYQTANDKAKALADRLTGRTRNEQRHEIIDITPSPAGELD